MTCFTLVSFTEDMGNLAVAVACVHPTCETELMGMATAFSFEIANMFKGRQGAFSEDRVRPGGLGRNLTSCFPITLVCCSSPGHCPGHLVSPRRVPTLKAQGQQDGTGQAPSARWWNLPCWKNPQQETAVYLLLMQCTTCCWHRNQSRVDGLSQYVIFKLEELGDKHHFNICFGLQTETKRRGEDSV